MFDVGAVSPWFHFLCCLVLFGAVWCSLVLKFIWIIRDFRNLSLPKAVPVTHLSFQNLTFSQCLQATCHPVTTSHPLGPLSPTSSSSSFSSSSSTPVRTNHK